MKRLRPFFSYFGAKYNIAPKYPAPRYGTICEWYAGSAQYALLYSDREVHLFEAYAPVAALWRYLIGATEADILALPDLPEGRTVRNLGLAPGPSALIGYWCNAGCPRPRQSLSQWASVTSSLWGPRVRERVAMQLPAIRHWRVWEGSHEDYAPHEIECTHFVDPPYTKAGSAYGVSSVDYTALAATCVEARGQVIACEAEGATWLPFRMLAEMKATTNGGARTSREVVWTK